MTDIKQYLKETNTVLLTKESFEYLKERASVLDKIRAEIAEYKDDKVIHDERNEMIDIVLDIIDKYKVESEEQA